MDELHNHTVLLDTVELCFPQSVPQGVLKPTDAPPL